MAKFAMLRSKNKPLFQKRFKAVGTVFLIYYAPVKNPTLFLKSDPVLKT